MLEKRFRYLTIFFIFLLSISLLASNTSQRTEHTITHTTLVTYEGPTLLKEFDNVEIKVEDEKLFIYEVPVNHDRVFSFKAPTTTAPVAFFDFEGSVNVEITIKDVEKIENVVVRPLAYGIKPSISGNSISFRLDYPTNYVVEYNNDPTKAIHLFTNTIEKDKPDPNNLPENMIYIGPGVYKADAIPIESNKIVYLAGGAYVFGQIRGENVENVTIKGRGILSGDLYKRTQASEFTIPIEFRHSKNIKIEDITILNPAGWAISAYFVDGLTIDNIKIITSRANGDGASLQSCKNVHVKNSFIRSWDDSLVVKNYDGGSTENIKFENIVIWTDLAQSIEIGYETYGEKIENVSFENITVLHNFHKPIISIHNADNAHISNISYKNITVEDAQIIGDNPAENYDDFFIDLQIAYNQLWSTSREERGTIDNVTIDNVVILDGKDDLVSRIAGYDEDHMITNVSINNLTYKGKKVKSPEDLNFVINQYTSGIAFNFTTDQSTGATPIYPYNLSLESMGVKTIKISTIPQNGFIVPEFAIKEQIEVYSGEKITGTFEVIATHGVGLLDWDDGSGPWEQHPHFARNVLDGDFQTAWIAKEWLNQTGEYAALSIVFDEPKEVGKVRIYGLPDSKIYQVQNIGLFGIRASSQRDVYTKILNGEDYEFTPATGNYIDMVMNPGEYKAIQLRFYYKEGSSYSARPFATEIEIYPASLTFNKPIEATPHEDVYEANNIVDGNFYTYYESKKGVWPAEVMIDLKEEATIQVINLHLPPLLQWDKREQSISIHSSLDGVNFQEIVEETKYEFDPKRNNIVTIKLNEPVTCGYVKFMFTSNTSGYGAQISEITIY
jgi:hypothetical protein